MHPAIGRILAQPIAHRGLHSRASGRVENSLEAAAAAVAAGFAIECDVQLSRDGEAMVFHDDTLDRLTREAGPVGARDAAELAALPLRGDGAIPSLGLVLERVAGRVPVVVEIKSRFDGDLRLAARAVALVTGYAGAVALKSFDAGVITHCRELGASCPLGIVGSDAEADLSRSPPVDFLSWRVDDLAALRRREPDQPLMCWTVRAPAQVAQAASHRAQIIFEGFVPSSRQVADLGAELGR